MTHSHTLINLPEADGVYQGKVRDVYYKGDCIAALVSNRISAFDVVYKEEIPAKGQVLNQVAAHFLKATQSICPNWLVSTPHARLSIGKKCEPIRIEMIVRGYLAGHAWREYQLGKRHICGVPVPENMLQNQQFKHPIITPSTKAVDGKDEDISEEDIIDQNIVGAELYTTLKDYSLALFDFGQKHANERGLILVDTKYEFGLDKNGQVTLIDEIHTPDSSRYFYADGYEDKLKNNQPQKQLSKEFVREWLMSIGYTGKPGQEIPRINDEVIEEISKRYIHIYELLTGKTFLLEEEPKDWAKLIHQSLLTCK